MIKKLNSNVEKNKTNDNNKYIIIVEAKRGESIVHSMTQFYLGKLCHRLGLFEGVVLLTQDTEPGESVTRVELAVEKDRFVDLMGFIEENLNPLTHLEDDTVYDYVRVFSTNKYAQGRITRYLKYYCEQRTSENEFFFEQENSHKETMDNGDAEMMEMKRYEKIVNFSPEMSAYREELRRVILSLKSIDALGVIFDNALLVAIDDGWGFSEFVEMISQEMQEAFEIKHTRIKVNEEKYPTGNRQEDTWEKQCDRIENFSANTRVKSKFGIIKYDLSTAVSAITTVEFKQRMSELKKAAKDIMLIFHVPYMDKKALDKYEEILSDVMSIRTVSVPPVSHENMVVYLKERLKRVEMDVDEDAIELLEQWICQEKSNGVFYGYDTLDKMVSELVYQKAANVQNGEDSSEMRRVAMSDIQKMLTYPMVAEDAYDLLNELIGIAKVKSKVREIVAQIKLQKELEELGKDVEKPCLHMLFTGNPGTGKTTVARIIGRIFRQEGLLRKGHFIEVQGGDFIFTKIGDTLEKIRSTCRDSYGSVLFIDEAYGMSVGHSGGNVTDELLPILVAEMENHRDDMCVILAGYQKEMEEFLKENSGLKSRISHIIEFSNYTRDELIRIFFSMVDGKFEYEKELQETLCEYIQNIPDQALEHKEFSNARFIRNLYESLWRKAAYRIKVNGEKNIILKKEDMVCLMEEEDFQTMVSERKNHRPIGFRMK